MVLCCGNDVVVELWWDLGGEEGDGCGHLPDCARAAQGVQATAGLRDFKALSRTPSSTHLKVLVCLLLGETTLLKDGSVTGHHRQLSSPGICR